MVKPRPQGSLENDVPPPPVVPYDAGMENGWTRRDNGAAEAGRQAGRWLDVKRAAEELNLSSDAVRKRIARGTLRSGKGEDGSVRVWLDGLEDRRDNDQTDGGTRAGLRLDDLIDAKDDALRDLRNQLEHMRRESERKDAIIMQMAQANSALAARVPELEAAPEQREPTLTASEGADGGAPSEPDKQQSWWKRFFGFE